MTMSCVSSLRFSDASIAILTTPLKALVDKHRGSTDACSGLKKRKLRMKDPDCPDRKTG